MTCLLSLSIKDDFSKVPSCTQNIPAPNYLVICLYLHVTFQLSFFTHLLYPSLLPGSLATHPHFIDTILLLSQILVNFFKKLSLVSPFQEASTIPLQSLSLYEWGSSLLSMLTICSSKSVHDLLNFTEVISGRRVIKFWPITWSSVMVNSKLGAAPEQFVMLKAGLWGPGAQVQRALSAAHSPALFTKCSARFQQKKETCAYS